MLTSGQIHVGVFMDCSDEMKRAWLALADQMHERIHPLRNLIVAALNRETARRTGAEFSEDNDSDPVVGLDDMLTALQGAVEITWGPAKLPQAFLDKARQLVVLIVAAIREADRFQQEEYNAEWN